MDLTAFLREWEGIIQAVWPEIPGFQARPRQLYTSVQGLRISFVEQLKSGQIKTPCVVLKVGKETHDPGWDVTGRVFRVPLTVFYIGPDLMKQGQIHAKLVALRRYLEDAATEWNTFQSPPERGNIDSSEESDVNANLVAESGVRITSGHIEWMPGLLVTMDL